MSSSSRSKHSLSGGPLGSSHGRTKVVYGRRGRFGRSSGGHVVGGSFRGSIGGVPGVRGVSARRIRLAGTVLVLVICGVIGAVSHHGTSSGSPSSHLSLAQVNRQLRQMQATFPTFAAVVSEGDVMTVLDNRHVIPDGMPTCPDDEPNVPGHSFTCTFPMLGTNGQTSTEQVKVSVAADQEELNVGTPTAASSS